MVERKVEQLSFDVGVTRFALNGGVEVEFNPSDSAFAERLFTLFTELDGKQKEYKAAKDKAKGAEIFDLARKMDTEIRAGIDGLFGVPVCDEAFGNMSVTALADGLPVWANLLLAVMDKMDERVVAERKRTNPRIEKYTKKYHK